LTIVSAAASALHYAHEHRGPDRRPLNIVHRDVSPANIIVGYAGQVKVVDFGIAKATMSASDTQSGTLKGKISYMAPEQCMNHPVDRRSDVFALGIVLWELTTVRRLFRGSSDFLTMTAIAQGDIPRPSKHRPDIPPDLEAIIMKALARDPAQRYQTADELRIALDELATRAALHTSLTAVATYLENEFGRKPEPWLDEVSPWVVPDVDFDGPDDPAAPPGGSVAPPPAVRAPTASTGSGTPMAWTPTPTPTKALPTGRRRLGVVVAISLPLIAAGVVAIRQISGSERVSSSPGAPPAAAKPPEPRAANPPDPAAAKSRDTETLPIDPVADPAATDSLAGSAGGAATETASNGSDADSGTGSADTAGSAKGSAANVAATTKHKRVPRKPARPSDPTTAPEWNPDKLFLKKKTK
jgi:serine/threonine-protein kinase